MAYVSSFLLITLILSELYYQQFLLQQCFKNGLIIYQQIPQMFSGLFWKEIFPFQIWSGGLSRKLIWLQVDNSNSTFFIERTILFLCLKEKAFVQTFFIKMCLNRFVPNDLIWNNGTSLTKKYKKIQMYLHQLNSNCSYPDKIVSRYGESGFKMSRRFQKSI